MSQIVAGWTRVEQWVSQVIDFSSEHHRDVWAANQIVGAPKVFPQHGGKIAGAWAQGDMFDDEFIVVEFSTSVFPDEIQIYETFNSGGVVRVSLRNVCEGETTAWKTVWQREAPFFDQQARIFVVRSDEIRSSGDINQIRLDVNCRAARNACHLDAVKLIGFTSQRRTSAEEMRLNLNELFVDETLPRDVSFELVDGTIFRSHRNFLCARSIFFRQLFATNPSTPIRIDGISARSFNEILRFLFTGTIDPHPHYETSLELLRRADEFRLGELYDVVLPVLRKQINAQNVLPICLSAAFPPHEDEIRLDDVVKLCGNFIRKNRRKTFQVEHFRQIDPKNLREFLLLLTAKVFVD